MVQAWVLLSGNEALRCEAMYHAMSCKGAAGCTRDACASLAADLVSQYIPSCRYAAHTGDSCTVRGLRNTRRPQCLAKKPAYLPRKADPPGMHVLAGCLQLTLTSWDKRKFESLGDKPGCLKDTICDNDVVSIANIASVFRRN